MSNQNHKFENLRPVSDMDLGIYENAIKYAMENDEVLNIAISGPYGSGKSSVIESYKEKEQNFKCIHISLSHFDSGHLSKTEEFQEKSLCKEPKNKKETLEVNENVLEGKIINQLIHQTNPKKIPQTNFKIKKPITKKKILKNTIFITIFFLLLTHILLFNKWSVFVKSISDDKLNSLLGLSIKPESLLLSILICVVIFMIGIYHLITLQKTKNIFKKVNIRGTEIEIFEESKESYFDKYLNEVIYIFEHADANTIIFEDIDRYNVNEIFGKLREINTLVNNKRVKDNKLRFFYLLRDDIFTSKDRTKFFDFIIPIVPVIDSSNSYDQFTRLLKKGTNIDEFDQQFLQELSLYIDDMRLLKNIYNEFLIYYKQISDIEIDRNKLLAIITYKNIFPKDFSDLQLNSGFVYNLFESKAEFINEELSKLDEELISASDEIEMVNNEKLESIDELDALFIVENINFKSLSNDVSSSYNTRIELMKAIKENEQDFISLEQHPYGNPKRTQINISKTINELISNEDYAKRKRIIEQINSGELEKLDEDKQRIVNEKFMLGSNKLKNVITKKNIDNIFSITATNLLGVKDHFVDIKGNPYFNLIKYLLRNGWIDEDYQSYMTHFYSDSLSSIDKNFLLSITNQLPKEYTYELTSPERVLPKIQEVDFNNEETLNFDLLDYLLRTKEENSVYLTRLLKQIKNTKNVSFINRFMDSGKEIESFIKKINIEWPEIFQYIIHENNIEESFVEKYAINSFYYSSEKDIEKLNDNNDLSEWLSNNSSFLEIANPNVDKIVKCLLQIKVKFEWVNPERANKELFEAVYRNDLYELNIDIINLFLENIYEYNHSLDFKHKNYTLILEKENEPLATYVRENISEYLEIVLNNCDEQISDDYEIAIQILNEKEIGIETKERYISYLDTEITFIEDIKDKELWEQLLKQKTIKYSVDNILDYYFENELNETLIDFVNSQDEKLSFNESLINDAYGDGFLEKIVSSIMNCNEIYLKQYEMIMKQAETVLNFSEEGIVDEKIRVLIDLDIIPMNESVLIFMREEYPNMLKHFIMHNIKDYVKSVINQDTFNHEEMLDLLNVDIDEAYKLELLQYSSHEVSIEFEEYSEAVKLHILQHNLDESEIVFWLQTYPNESSRIKQNLMDLSIVHIESIVSNEYQLPYNLLIDIFKSNKLDKELEKDLLVLATPNLKFYEVKECLSILEMEDFISLFDKKRPRFTINETNRKLLTIFEERNWITKFYKDKKQPDDYRAIGRNLNSVFEK